MTIANVLQVKFIYLTFSIAYCFFIKSVRHNHLAVNSLNKISDILIDTGTSSEKIDFYLKSLRSAGWEDVKDLLLFAADFRSRPEVLADVLQKDFGFNAYDAHKLRAVLSKLLSHHSNLVEVVDSKIHSITNYEVEHAAPLTNVEDPKGKRKKRAIFKDFVVKGKSRATVNCQINASFEYGLSSAEFGSIYLNLANEMSAFYTYMTESSLLSQELPIRKATADVYIRHAKLFLGWIVKHEILKLSHDQNFSLKDIFPSKERDSSQLVLSFLKWLKNERKISTTYEANILRGLTKLMKFRFYKGNQT